MQRVGIFLLLFVWFAVGCAGRNGVQTPIPEADLLFADQFSPGETGRWRIEGDALSSATLQNGQLTIAVNEAEMVHYTTLDNQFFTDFELDVETKLVAGNPENSFGILFRMVDDQQFYRFALTGHGLYTVERRDGQTRESLSQGWLDSNDLVQGVGALNRLQIRAVGDLFTFTINDVVALEVTDGNYAQGLIALDAGTFARPGIEVAFDNLAITRP